MSNRNVARKTLISFLATIGVIAGFFVLDSLPDDWFDFDFSASNTQSVQISDKLSELTKKNNKKQTLEEAKESIAKKNRQRRKSQYWIWAEEGKTDLLLEKIAKADRRQHEKRANMLFAIGKNLKPRGEWPSGFDDVKLNRLLNKLEQMAFDTEYRKLVVTIVNTLADIGKTIPDHQDRIGEILAKIYEVDARPGIRGRVITGFATMQSESGFRFIDQALKNGDNALVSSSLYALDRYAAQTSTKKDAIQRMTTVVRSNSVQRVLALKLLAKNGDRKVASVVPAFLGEKASESEVEAAAYAVEKLRLKQYGPLLVKHKGKVSGPTARQINEALKAID